MTAEEEIKKRLEELTKAIPPDEMLVKNVMSSITAKPIGESGIINKSKSKLIIRRLIMSRFTKFATAAVIVIVAGVGIRYFTGRGTTPVYGITDMPELFRTARTVHLKGWLYHPGCKTPDGNDVPPVNLERWNDLENRREWTTTSSSSGRSDATTIGVGELITDRLYRLRLNHTEKRGYFAQKSEYQQMLEKHLNKDNPTALIFGDISKLDDFVEIGQEQVDGVDCDIWQREEVFSATGHENRYRYWLSPNTGDCKRTQYWMRWGSKQQWELRHEYYKIERNVNIPEGIFTMNIPKDYEARNTRETAMVLPLGNPMSACGFGVGYGYAISFTMSDGSVIWGWNSFDQESEKPQDEFFRGLEFGGPLPKLPIVFNALKPGCEPKDITYSSHHITYTRKADRFTEWAIYIPDGTPPKNVKEFGYHALYTFNIGRKSRFVPSIGVPYGLLIETKEVFDELVLGAMAELSDDRKAPDEVSYESVLQLAERIRGSMAQ